MWLYWLLLVVSWSAYVNTIDGDFVHDDISAIKLNGDVTGDTVSYWNIFTNDFWGTSMTDDTSHKSYRPLTILSFRWNFCVGGMNPRGYHLVNVVLHGVVSVLFAFVARRYLNNSAETTLFSAVLFAIHPIHTEAVAGIVGRADILATLFFLLCFASYHRGALEEETGHRWKPHLFRLLSVVFAVASLTAKEHGITALPVAILWDVITIKTKHGGPLWSLRRGLQRIVLTLAAVLLMLVWRLSMLNGKLPVFSDQDNPVVFARNLKTRILTLLYLPAVNGGLLLAPIWLSYDWQTGSIPLIEQWSDSRNLLTFIFYLSLVSVVALSFLKKDKVIIWSCLVMIVPMLPSSNLFFPIGFVIAERILYLPSLGFCLLVGRGLNNCWMSMKGHRRLKRLFILSTVAVTSVLLTKTLCRNAEWSSRTTLFTSGLRTLPHNAKIHYNYANLQKDSEDWQRAVLHYRRAIKLWPSYSSAHNNLGTVLLAQAEEVTSDKESVINQAEKHFQQALKWHPNHIHARYNLAVISINQKNFSKAAILLEEILRHNPKDSAATRLFHWLTQRSIKTPKAIGLDPQLADSSKNVSDWNVNLKSPVKEITGLADLLLELMEK